MDRDVKRGKIVFVDDDEQAIAGYITHLRSEGFTNIVALHSVRALGDVVRESPDLLFLDITGVATNIDQQDEGISVLRFVRRHSPWTRIVVLSGSTFEVDLAPELADADRCITKASLSLAELVELTEEELLESFSPETRNAKILSAISTRMEALELSWLQRKRLNKLLREANEHKGDSAYDWEKLGRRTKGVLKGCLELAGLIQKLL